MVKFSSKLKVKIVLEYLSGTSSTLLNRKYNIDGSATVLLWVRMYQKYGINGLINKHSKHAYSYMYKLKVLHWMRLHKSSYPETALHFNISSPSSIFVWERRLENGTLNHMTIKHPLKKNLTKSNIKQIKVLEKENLSLSIQLKYNQLINKYDQYKSIEIINQSFHKIGLSSILRILKIPRSSYYYHKKATLSLDKQLIESEVKKVVSEHKTYGYLRITACLRSKGKIVNHKCVQRIMHKYGLQCKLFSKKKRKYSSYKGQVGHIAPNILHGDFKADYFGQKLTTDVSEFRYGNHSINQKVYLSPVMDLYSDKIIAYSISSPPSVSFTLKALKHALDIVKNNQIKTIVHSDQGVQYQSHEWVNTIKAYNVIQSMSRKGTCLDNAQMESFFHIMKSEMMNVHYDTKESLIQAMKCWIKDYNNNRIKEKLGYQSPNQYLGLIS
ncbi:IS3 family transposase [Apilactobacillus xinyiensis]|uniref:IS3 family transposase n=1 Tax=Apilactobacillus xinyiensis TaxID=2841032 RepID=UPI001C7E0B12|nr:IS3 family transposase [Apilactobacillus xinyiensis]